MATVTDAAAVPVAGAVTLVKEDVDVVKIDKPKKRFALSRKKKVETQADKQVLAVSLSKLFSLADTTDKILMVVGIIASLVSSAGWPYFIVYFGKTLDGLNSASDIRGTVLPFVKIFLVVGSIALVSGATFVYTWTIAGERQAQKIKEAYVTAILRQDTGWFDSHPAGQLPTMVTSLMSKIQDGIGRKLPDVTMNLGGAIGCLIAALYLNPVLAAILLCCMPVIGITVGAVTKLMSKSTIEGQGHYGKAGAVANEVFAGIRTVASLCAEPWEIKRYSKHLLSAEKAGILNGTQNGLGKSSMFFAFYLSYALAFWYGIKQVMDDKENGCTKNCASGGKVISSVFGVLFASMQLGQMSPGLTALGLARTSAVSVFETIDRTPPIDSAAETGEKPEITHGELTIDHIAFHYPARPDDAVYHDVNLKIAVGETLALVGPSGGGKSTMTKLLLRFYDPTAGSVRLDGRDIRTLHLRWYRYQIGYVGQEPVLFAGSIRDNIASGKPGATDEEIIEAAKAANAHNFVKSFPQGYGTDCGEGGMQLSGGQKQRIAIARAIIKDPAVLLLDEATSALDSESEKVVQQALDRLHQLKKRTTVTIAHRLSTIQNSDRIAVIANKGVAELGTHTELMATGGIYAQLCASQGAAQQKEDERKREERIQRQSSAADADGVHGVDSVDVSLPEASIVLSPTSKHGLVTVPLNGEETKESRDMIVTESLKDGTRSDLQRQRSRSGSSFQVQMQADAKAELTDKQKKVAAKGDPMAPMGELWALNKPDAGWIALGLFGALLAGAMFPLEGIVIANIQNAFYQDDPKKGRELGNHWVLGFVAMAVFVVIGHVSLAAGFATAGERMTRKLRESAFEAILRHDIGWFDSDENGTGTLTTRLEKDASTVSKATGMSLGHKVQLCMTLLLGIIVGLAAAWQVGLVAIACIPAIGFAGVMQMAMLSGGYGDAEGLDGGSGAGKILGGALNGITTVQAFNLQASLSGRYRTAIQGTISARKKRGLISGLGFGYGQLAMFWVFALLFWFGSGLVADGKVSFLNFFMAMFAVILGAFGIGQVNADMGAQKAGQQAAYRIFALSKQGYKIDPMGKDGAKPDTLDGALSFRNIKFAYPTRPSQMIYGGPLAPEGFNLEVRAGDTVALCGPSGGGKSTAIGLLMRFYDPLDGTICVDGRDIQELNIGWLRQSIGYVGQEPCLFTGSIFENIAKGMPSATIEQVESAAKAANAHDFIMSFSEGYQTDVGEKSALLSGGQKQRIAIARAIIKDPKILLLDEATSALDNESERQVQAALDHLQSLKRRTTLVVAHRLTTVRNSDKIVILSGGKVSESGTHKELMELNGTYAGLYRRQTDKFQ